MSNTKEAWEEVLSKIEGLGLKLKYHLEAERAEEAAEDAADAVEDAADAVDDAAASVAEVVDGDTGVDALKDGAEKASEALKNEFSSLTAGVEKFVDMLDDAFDAFGSASKDDGVRADMRDIGETLRNALASTWNDAGADLREVLTRPKRAADDDSIIGEIIDPEADDASDS